MKRALCIALSALALAVLFTFAADEIKVKPQLTVDNGVYTLERKPGTIQIDQINPDASDITQTIGTGSETLVEVAAGVVTNGIYWFRNLTTNTTFYVHIGTVSNAIFHPFLRLNAEEVSQGRLHETNDIYARAYGGSVSLRAIVLED
jgi:hypothetical protein